MAYLLIFIQAFLMYVVAALMFGYSWNPTLLQAITTPEFIIPVIATIGGIYFSVRSLSKKITSRTRSTFRLISLLLILLTVFAFTFSWHTSTQYAPPSPLEIYKPTGSSTIPGMSQGGTFSKASSTVALISQGKTLSNQDIDAAIVGINRLQGIDISKDTAGTGYVLFNNHGYLQNNFLAKGDLNNDGYEDALFEGLWCAASCGDDFTLIINKDGKQAYVAEMDPPGLQASGAGYATINDVSIKGQTISITFAENLGHIYTYKYRLSIDGEGYGLRKVGQAAGSLN